MKSKERHATTDLCLSDMEAGTMSTETQKQGLSFKSKDTGIKKSDLG